MKLAALVIGLLLVCGFAAYAQGPFADVPTDHWAYEAVNQLQQDGILIGYPDGTFGGKRAMTRYEFAVAIARMIPIIQGGMGGGITQEQFNALQNRVAELEKRPAGGTVDTSNLCTKAECEAIRRLVDEFRDELAALGVDVDALKRDVAALNDRVAAIEKELRRFVWNAEVDVIGTAGDLKTPGSFLGAAFDMDDRAIQSDDMMENISVLENVNLKFRGGLTENVTANAMGVIGNYLSWIGTVDDYSVFDRPDSRATGLETDAALYYANIDWALGNGALSLGRFPIQWTPYTLKMIDVDSYNAISYTDSGNYPMDGAKFDWRFGQAFRLNAYAAKNNQHELLANGLTAQPTVGLYNDVLGVGVPYHIAGGHAAGGLDFIDQSAGVRLQFGDMAKYTIGGSWIQAGGVAVAPALADYDTVDIFGADLNWNLGSFIVGANWAQSDTKGVGATADVDDDNQAIDGKLGFKAGKFGINAGWKRVESNFAAPGYWDKLGRWTNPTNVEGWYADLVFGLTSNLSIVAKAAIYEGDRDLGFGNVGMNDDGDEVDYYQAGLKWGLSTTNTVTLGAEWVNWDTTEAGEADEVYYNIGWAYQMSPSAGFKLLYQIVDYDADSVLSPYGADYEGNVAVAQFGVKF